VITEVDTSVLLDVFGAHPRFGSHCADALRNCLRQGEVVACVAVRSETRVAFPSDHAFFDAMRTLEIGLSSIAEQAATLAGRIHKKHRAAGGKRDRVVADFLIGAHAALQCDRLLTRDRGYYRKYFAGLSVIEPSA
jgi:predicted nucleic acid-binding protein